MTERKSHHAPDITSAATPSRLPCYAARVR